MKFSPIAESVATQVENIFKKASIPTVTHTRVVQMVTSYHEEYYKIRKSFNRDKVKDFSRIDWKFLSLMLGGKYLILQHVSVK